jgi:hypothetical protein
MLLLAVVTVSAACGDAGQGLPSWETAHTSTHWWMSATAVSDAEQWVVGGTTTEGAILRFDGSAATEIAHGSDVGLLNWIHRFDSGAFIVVGNDGAVLRSEDGSTWTRDTPITDHDLWGVWGASPDDVWAVGGDAAGDAPTILRDTGSGFVQVDLPDLERPGVGVLFKVWGSAADNMYIVGQHGIVLRWNGSSLEELFVGISEDLIGIWGTDADRVVAVGGRRNAQAVLWDGTEWRALDLAKHSGLNGVWMSDDTIHVAGLDGTVGIIDFVSGDATIDRVDTPVDLHAVTGTGSSITIVGGEFGTGAEGPFLGQIWTAPVG